MKRVRANSRGLGNRNILTSSSEKLCQGTVAGDLLVLFGPVLREPVLARAPSDLLEGLFRMQLSHFEPCFAACAPCLLEIIAQ